MLKIEGKLAVIFLKRLSFQTKLRYVTPQPRVSDGGKGKDAQIEGEIGSFAGWIQYARK
jgi:hypothetical protein